MNTTEFLQRVKSSITFPSYQARLTDSDILDFANEEQELTISELVTSLREEFFVFIEETDVTAFTEKVYVPSRAIGRSVRTVEAHTGADSPIQLQRISFDDKSMYSDNLAGSPMGVYWRDDYIYFRPVPNIDFTLDIFYPMQLSNLVATSRTSSITAVGDDTLTLVKVPSNITIGSYIDITKNVPGYRPVKIDQLVTGIAGTTLTLSGYSALDPIADVSTGFAVSLASETSILQMPKEVQIVLIKTTARRILQAEGMIEQVKLMDDIIQRAVTNARNCCAPRDEGSSESIINYNGFLRGRTMGRRQRRMTLT